MATIIISFVMMIVSLTVEIRCSVYKVIHHVGDALLLYIFSVILAVFIVIIVLFVCVKLCLLLFVCHSLAFNYFCYHIFMQVKPI